MTSRPVSHLVRMMFHLVVLLEPFSCYKNDYPSRHGLDGRELDVWPCSPSLARTYLTAVRRPAWCSACVPVAAVLLDPTPGPARRYLR